MTTTHAIDLGIRRADRRRPGDRRGHRRRRLLRRPGDALAAARRRAPAGSRPADVRAVRRALPAARRDVPDRRRQRRRRVAAAATRNCMTAEQEEAFGASAAGPRRARRRPLLPDWPRPSPSTTPTSRSTTASSCPPCRRPRAGASGRRSCATMLRAGRPRRACPPTTRRPRPGTAPSTSGTATSTRASSRCPTAARPSGGCGGNHADLPRRWVGGTAPHQHTVSESAVTAQLSPRRAGPSARPLSGRVAAASCWRHRVTEGSSKRPSLVSEALAAPADRDAAERGVSVR